MIDVTTPTRFRRCIQETDDDRETWQLRVEWDLDDSTLIEIATERMTSPSSDSQVVRGLGHVLCLGGDDVEWLHARLGELLEHRRAAR